MCFKRFEIESSDLLCMTVGLNFYTKIGLRSLEENVPNIRLYFIILFFPNEKVIMCKLRAK